MKILFCLASSALVFAACSNSGNDSASSGEPAYTIPTPPVITAADTSKKTNVPTIQAPPANTTTTPQPSTPSEKVALNPAHGMPGHRCDIPEGAPLNSAPISTTIPANGVNNNPVINQPSPAKTNVQLNPAHGMPGHDCSIPVGQPLKS